ncbi:O-succinylbenzoic acid--CoA ligase [Erwinia billingiae Eb661]|uniref:O-succinylbenzoic acid--CoA ligase n=1 Tax=Erwinia billingiae (strain Eb661) TaxID=634500 RepID=D8MUS2_ERWBE|nr:o-succinylbenzoate--CoA ligase [Erwinia billingiae]CAX60579.1 O-succinylbenzoic acid--CoA ligase [Erwinia billingiae Eb661]
MAALSDWPWRHWAKQQPDEPALINQGATFSWLQLARQIDQLATGLMQQGVRSGCGVVLKARNSQPALLAYLALLQCGARIIPLNPQLPATQLAVILPALNADFALLLDGEPVADMVPLRWVVANGSPRHQWDDRLIATLTLTSGSCGQPKAAAHTFAAHLASAAGVVDAMNFTRQDRWLLSLPLFHVSGQGIVWRWLRRGAGLVLADGLALPQALEHCTFASLVPTQLWRLLQQPELPGRLRNVLLGGAAIPQSLTQQAEARGIACWCGYGLTETASTVAAKRADKRSGVGLALAGHQIRIRNGEVQLKSPALACGYWHDGELLPLTDANGWFASRDGGHLEQGELVLTGRLDNQFFSAGEGIQPEQIESLLMSHPAVSQAFIVPREDREFGQRPVALVALTADLPLTALAEWAKGRLAGFQRPVSWYPLPELDSGGIKLSRQRLTQWVAQQEKGRQ